jgi:hypothetical protein
MCKNWERIFGAIFHNTNIIFGKKLKFLNNTENYSAKYIYFIECRWNRD